MSNYYNYNGKTETFLKFSNQLKLLIDNGSLRNFILKYEDSYVCPICFEQFDKSYLQKRSGNYLTVEHSPPFSLGGEKVTLLCKNCNNNTGTQIDSHLKHYIDYLDMGNFYPGTTQQGFTNYEGKKVQGILEISDTGKLQMHHKMRNNNPRLFDKFKYTIQKGAFLQFFPKFRQFDQRLVDLAILKINYIISFSKFGYSLILHPYYQIVRNQLMNPHLKIFTLPTYVSNQFYESQIGTYYVTTKGLESILNIFLLKTEYSQTVIGSFMPIPKNPMELLSQNISLIAEQNDDDVVFHANKFDENVNLFGDINEIARIMRWYYI